MSTQRDGAQPGKQFPWLPGETVVDHVSLKLRYESISNWAFTVGPDGTIKVFRWEQEDLETETPMDTPVLERTYGRRLERSGDLELQSLFHPQEVAAEAEHFKANSSVFHAVLTWSFDKNDSLGNGLAYSVYVFREADSKRELVYTDKWVNPWLKQFAVEDLNGDGVPEIVDVGTLARGACMRIRTIDSAGKVSLMQEDVCGYEVRVEHGVEGKGPEILVRDGRWDRKVTAYTWSAAAKRFVKQ